MSDSPIPNTPTVTTNKQQLDVAFIHQFLKDTYWAKGRTLLEVQQTIQHSLCFGIYLQNQQIGFARVVTDTIVFAYLMDVFIDPAHRGQGYSKILLEAILAHDTLRNVQSFYLKTGDAHGLYEQFGFKVIPEPQLFMERKI